MEKGYAFDLHTLASTYLGPDEFGRDQFDNTRSEMGELVYQLKYKRDKSVIPKIIELLTAITGIEKFDFIIPVPSSMARFFSRLMRSQRHSGNSETYLFSSDF